MQALSLRTQARLWYWQRMSAMVLAACVVLHIVVIVYAVHSGLSEQAILGRTHQNWFFAGFYTLFVLACAVHVPIGLLRIAEEWLGWRGRSAHFACGIVTLGLVALGLRAVMGVIL
ncbi:Succinate dehydrogenase/Fumarate reductase transmembrane subunit [Caballeronia calidae]|uniref:Succinate dehydrogenase/Fumarate reductase transmembrane subunit n=1 Tax=Caballeronia calidae TaxID=1777139 RepID=A0A158EGF1_9BURK|nr:succinate dehydrogenase [Caballeronia calidae]SAL05486.1 Succinate dehydrogenase/Fumarate reductase transmembrane subunit [Caballeronia calidae]